MSGCGCIVGNSSLTGVTEGLPVTRQLGKSVCATGGSDRFTNVGWGMDDLTTSFLHFSLRLFFRIFSARFQDPQRTFAPVHR